MEIIREKLHKYIAVYGPLDERTLKVSQELDKLIVEEMKGEKKK